MPIHARYISFYLILFISVLLSGAYANTDTKPILVICSYNPAAHQTSVTISDFMDEFSKSGGKCNIEIENMNCKSFSESPRWKGMMQQILSKYTGDKQPGLII